MNKKFTKFFSLHVILALGLIAFNPFSPGKEAFTIELSPKVNDVLDCGSNSIVEVVVVGLANGNQTVNLSNTGDIIEIMAEVWVEQSDCPDSEYPSSNLTIRADGNTQVTSYSDVIQHTGSTVPERIYRTTFSGSFNSVTVQDNMGCAVSSMALYIVRSLPGGNATFEVNDIELNSGGGLSDDCYSTSIEIGTSSSTRDVDIYVPIHEKDNSRTVSVFASAGSVFESSTITSNLGNEGGLVSITLENVPGDETSIDIEVCSPAGNGDSFGIGAVAASINVCDACGLDDPGEISSDQNSCGPFIPSLLTCTNASPSDVSYQWQLSTDDGSTWTNISNTNSKNYNPGYVTQTTLFRRLARRSADCEWSPSNTVIIEVFSIPIISLGENPSIFLGNSYSIIPEIAGGTPPFSYSWSSGLGTGSSVLVDPIQPTTISVTVTDNNGCASSASIFIDVDPQPFDCGTNLLTNGGFENGFSNWTTTGYVSLDDRRYVQEGNYYAFLWSSSGTATISQKVYNIVPGATYDLTFYGGTHQASFSHLLELNFFEASGAFLESTTEEVDFVVGCCSFSIEYPMQLYSLSTVAPENANYVEVRALSENGDFLKIDKLCLEGPTCIYPVPVDDNYDICSQSVLEANVAENDFELLNPTYRITEGPSNGEAVIDESGNLTYTPVHGFSGTDEILGEVCNNGNCCTSFSITLSIEASPEVTFDYEEPVCENNSGIISFYFNDVSGRSNIEFSIDGGSTYPLNVLDNSGSTNFSDLPAGVYHLFTRWGNDECPVDLGEVTLNNLNGDLEASIVGTPTVCEGESAVLSVLTSGGTGPFSYIWSHELGNSASVEVTPSVTETYAVTVTDENDCEAIKSYEVLVYNGVSLNIETFNPSCGQHNGYLIGTPHNPNDYCLVYRLYNYSTEQWVGDYQTIPAFFNLPPGLYRIKKWVNPDCDSNFSDVICYQAFPNDALELIDSEGPSLEIELGDVSCFNGNDGSIDLNVNGGTAPYTYNWSTGNTEEDLSGLTAGLYTVTITDANGCSTTATRTLTQPAELICESIEATDATGAGFTNGSIDLRVSGGTAPFTYRWSNGATTQDIAGLGRGTYSVTITDSEGCETSCSATVNEPSAISCEIEATNVSCNGEEDGVITVTAEGGSGVYEYSLDDIAYTTNNVFSDLAAGQYTVFVRDANEILATSSCQIRISEPDALTATTTGTNISCLNGSDGSIDLIVNGGTAPYTYSWNTGSTQEDLSGLTAGLYTVTITDANACEFNLEIVLDHIPPLFVNITNDQIICVGDEVVLEAIPGGGSGNYSYVWSNGVTTSTQTVSPDVSSSYEVTVTDGNGCIDTKSVTLEVHQPQVSLSVDPLNQEVIEGNTATFTVTVENDGPIALRDLVIKDESLVTGFNEIITELNPGVSVTFDIEVSDVLAGFSLPFSLQGYTYDDNNDIVCTINASSQATVVLKKLIDLGINKGINIPDPNVGDEVIFTILAFNEGPSTATGVEILDQLPDGFEYISHRGPGSYDPISGIWTLPALLPDDTIALRMTVTVLPEGDYVNKAEVVKSNEQDIDSNPGNGIDQDGDQQVDDDPDDEDDGDAVSVNPTPIVDLELNKTIDNENPRVGDEVTFTISVYNNGPSTATGMEVLEDIPSGYRYINHQAPGFYDVNTGVWAVESIAAGETVSLLITVEVLLTGNYTNHAEIIHVNEKDKDSSAGNGVDGDGDGDVSDDPNDEDDGDGVSIKPLVCLLEANTSNLICDNNGTPSDPSDDLFYFDLLVSGENTNNGWLIIGGLSDEVGRTGVMDQVQTFGPYPINNGPVSFLIQDENYTYCTVEKQIFPPATCSNECDLKARAENIICQDNGTPSDPSDDTFTFDVYIEGANKGDFWVDDNGKTGDYDILIPYGPFPIKDGGRIINFEDNENPNCSIGLDVSPPLSCSEQCAITYIISPVICDDDLTLADPTDDTFTFELLVSGNNTSGSWRSNIGRRGNYDEPETFGPFKIADGPISFSVWDAEDINCSFDLDIEPPVPCSNDCEIFIDTEEPVCDDNGTPAYPDDDTYYVMVTVTGFNTSSEWRAFGEDFGGQYGVPVKYGPFLVKSGLKVLSVEDSRDESCSAVVAIDPPATCSDDCSILIEDANPVCNNNGTPSDPSDDTFTVNLKITGRNANGEWRDGNGRSGVYGQIVAFGPFEIAKGAVNIEIFDQLEPACKATAHINPPETCSDACAIELVEVSKTCLDNGTPSDPSDDQFTVLIAVFGQNTNNGWIASDGTRGNYGESWRFGPFPISEGIQSIQVSDALETTCRQSIQVVPASTCSDDCAVLATGSNSVCNDNGSPSDPSDDTFTFTLTVEGQNSSNSWVADNGLRGNYGVPVNTGVYKISDSRATFVISDAQDLSCSYNFQMKAPETCSNTCAIITEVVEQICDDNGTSNNPTDDLIFVDVKITGANSGNGWIAEDGKEGLYGEIERFGPYPAGSGAVSIQIRDKQYTECSSIVNLTVLNSCSNECGIFAEVLNKTCNDSGTPSDPSDDTFTFSVLLKGYNQGDSWRANDGKTGRYNEIKEFGPYRISSGTVSLRFVDVLDRGCFTDISVTPPSTCSDQCTIRLTEVQKICSDEGTPSDPLDDTFTFRIAVTGFNNGAEWTTNAGIKGAYNTTAFFGPYPIADGPQTLQFFDATNGTCTSAITILPPLTCSEVCATPEIVAELPVCNDNGTPGNPNDDFFTLEVIVNGNASLPGWYSSKGNTGKYGEPATLGPFPSKGEMMSVEITDLSDSSCSVNLPIQAPRPCSNECGLFAQLAGEQCDDNGTPDDTSDDLFSFYVLISGANTETYWQSSDGKTGDYGKIVEFGPYSLLQGPISITFNDYNHIECSTTIEVVPPQNCNTNCRVRASVSNLVCNDSGTPSEPFDDTFEFDLIVEGNLTSASWASDLGIGGVYGSPAHFGPFPIELGAIQIIVNDAEDIYCKTKVEVIPPNTCSDQCEVDAIVALLNCNDNRTVFDPSDDTYSFIATIIGKNIGPTWVASDGSTGNFNEPKIFGPLKIADGIVAMNFADEMSPGCNMDIVVDPAETCSDLCLMNATVKTFDCNNNGSPSDASDDIFYIDVLVIGANVSSGWIASNGETGNYDIPERMGPFLIANGDFTLNFTDINNPNCSYELKVKAPAPCSFECELNIELLSKICNDNNTPNDPNDDTFTFEVKVSGNNTSGFWVSSTGITKAFNEKHRFGPYRIVDGEVKISFFDRNKGKCSRELAVTPPQNCSRPCGIEITPSKRLCHNNGTPNYEADDYFTVDFVITGWNLSENWVCSNGMTGKYGEKVTFGDFPIADGVVSFTFRDAEKEGCDASISINPPQECSFEFCEITEIDLIAIRCDPNGTPAIPGDDKYYCTLVVDGNSKNNPGGGWDSSEGISGKYGEEVEFGPFPINVSSKTIYIYDNQSSDCSGQIQITAPDPCSLEQSCKISALADHVECDDAGTPADPRDDTYTFELVVKGNSTSGKWIANDPGQTTGTFNIPVKMGPYLIRDGEKIVEVQDEQYPGCTDQITIRPPAPCSDECKIASEIFNIICNDNHTSDKSDDDTYTFELLLLSNGGGNEWITAINGKYISGEYGKPKLIGPLPVSSQQLSFEIADKNNPSCKKLVQLSPPSSCSSDCPISAAILGEPLCDDNGTPDDPDDDLFFIDMTILGKQSNGTWKANDPNNSFGTYGSTIKLGPYLVKNGNLNFSITDAQNADCSRNIVIEAPFACSKGCSVKTEVLNLTCFDNGTPEDPSDDLFDFDLMVYSQNGSVGWTTLAGGEIIYGFYGQVKHFGPFKIENGPINLNLVDLIQLDCSVALQVLPPVPCSAKGTSLLVECPDSEMEVRIHSGECEADVLIPLPKITGDCDPESFVLTTEVFDEFNINIATLRPSDNRNLTGISAGGYTIKYVVTDNCDNEAVSNCEFRVLAPDTAEGGYLDTVRVYIETEGNNILKLEEVPGLLQSDCDVEVLEIRRHYTKGHRTCETIVSPFYSIWSDAVEYTCCEAGDFILTEIRILNETDQEQVWSIRVEVLDTTPPLLTGLSDLLVDCASLPVDFDPQNIESFPTLFGVPQLSDNCNTDWIAIEPIVTVNNPCDIKIVRKFQAIDDSGNSSDTLVQTIVIGDENALQTPSIHGIVMTPGRRMISGVRMQLSGKMQLKTETDLSGNYDFEDLLGKSEYIVTPILDENFRNGVTTLDLIELNRFLLGKVQWTSPYKYIAADADNSKHLSALDLLEVRRLILGNIDRYRRNTSWRFIHLDYVFEDSANPWKVQFPENKEVIINEKEDAEADFYGVKIGDVNESASPNNLIQIETRQPAGVFEIETQNKLLNKGNTYELFFFAPSISSILGFQLALHFDTDAIEVEEIIPGILKEEHIGMRFLENGTLHFSWHEIEDRHYLLTNSPVLFSIKVKALKEGTVKDFVRIRPGFIHPEAYHLSQQVLDVGLKLKDGEASAEISPKLILYQNYPNPFYGTTIIPFELPEASRTVLIISDPVGKILKKMEATFDAGKQQFEVSGNDLPEGVLFYEIRTSSARGIRKMIQKK